MYFLCSFAKKTKIEILYSKYTTHKQEQQ